jgi:hypothetical protein
VLSISSHGTYMRCAVLLGRLRKFEIVWSITIHDMNEKNEENENEVIFPPDTERQPCLIKALQAESTQNRCPHNQSLTMIDSSPITAGEGYAGIIMAWLWLRLIYEPLILGVGSGDPPVG